MAKPNLFSEKINPRSLIWILVWGIGVFGLVRGVDFGIRTWQGQVETLAQEEIRLSRLMGWVEASDQVAQQHRALLGSDGAGRQDASWESLQGLQEVAQRVGLSVEELRPTLLKGRRGEPNRLRLEVKLRGQLAAMSQFLEQIPEVVSGIQLDHVRLSPHKEFGAQGLFRLSVAEA